MTRTCAWHQCRKRIDETQSHVRVRLEDGYYRYWCCFAHCEASLDGLDDTAANDERAEAA